MGKSEMSDQAESMKLFGRWSYEDVKVTDQSLQNYIAIETKRARVYVPHTAGRYQVKKFRKAQCPIIERVLNTIQHHGRNAGKKVKAMRIMRQTLELIELQTGENPIQVVVDAITNCGPREDSTKIGKGGSAKRQAVDVSSFRRISQAVFFLTSYARKASFRKTKNIAECLAAEFMSAASNDSS